MSTEKQERTPCLPMYHFIINPNAGSGRGWKVWRAIAGYMDRHNIEYEAVLTNGCIMAKMETLPAKHEAE